ncbi:hypothetical protein [Humibacter ginsenosidimutans]|uniref:Uncharacterized protein n=1 Tax=Humibacter ginsenosidimutans TaxID=2599293 RepID=A0A5B8M4S2_9MICO|nr:hypothetical protein [Humibacter ginsenosidimutans]QDZ15336.1 hypothetical protein FPZ11_11680 [Humibacter ginsenosidimutans]
MLSLRFPRDLVMIGAIFGVAAFAWAGWAQEGPPSLAWSIVLGVLSLLGLAVAGLSIPLAVRNWRTGSAISPRKRAFRVYTIVVWIEVVLAAAGGILLPISGDEQLVAPFIMLIVAVHFFFLAPVFGQPILHVTGGLLVIVAVVSAFVPTATAAHSFWCGILGAPVFLVVGVWCFVVGRREFKRASAAAAGATG